MSHFIRSSFAVFFGFATSFLGYAMATPTHDDKSPVLIADADKPIIPLSVTAAPSGGFIIVGSSGMAAWAAKVDQVGRLQWQYAEGYSDKIGYPPPPRPEFRGVVPMHDGSFLLCGSNSAIGGAAAVITKINSAGHALSQGILTPSGDLAQYKSRAEIDACVAGKSGALLVGQITIPKLNGESGSSSRAQNYYWIVALDEAGNRKWEKAIPFRFGDISVVTSKNFTALKTGENLVFAASDTNNTDIYILDDNGGVVAQKRVSGHFRLVRPVQSDNLIQLIGRAPAASTEMAPLSIFTFDTHLAVQASIAADPAPRFSPTTTYRLADQTLVSFGTAQHSVGRRYRAEAMKITQRLKLINRVELENFDLDDAGQVWAVSSINQGSRFIFVNSVVSRKLENSAETTAISSPQFKRGMLVDFINFE